MDSEISPEQLHNHLTTLLATGQAQELVTTMLKHQHVFNEERKGPILFDDDNAEPAVELQSPVYYAAEAVKQGLAKPEEIVPALREVWQCPKKTRDGFALDNFCRDTTHVDKVTFLHCLDQEWPKDLPVGVGSVFDHAHSVYEGASPDAQKQLAPFLVEKHLRSEPSNKKTVLVKKMLQSTHAASDHPERLRAVLATADFCIGAGIKPEEAPIVGSKDIDPVIKRFDTLGQNGHHTPLDIGRKYAEMNESIAKHLVLPIYAEAHTLQTKEKIFGADLDVYQELALAETKKILWEKTSGQDPVSLQRRLDVVSRFERNEGILFGSLPDSDHVNHKWEPLVQHDVKTDNGSQIHFITSKDELRQKVSRFNNCAMGKLNDYMYGGHHVMVITAPDGTEAMAQVSSNHVNKRIDVAETPKLPLFKGQNQDGQFCNHPDINQAFKELQHKIERGEIAVDYQGLEDARKKRASEKFTGNAAIAMKCGYDAAQQNAREQVFATYQERLFSRGDYNRLKGFETQGAFAAQTGLASKAETHVTMYHALRNGNEIVAPIATREPAPEVANKIRLQAATV